MRNLLEDELYPTEQLLGKLSQKLTVCIYIFICRHKTQRSNTGNNTLHDIQNILYNECFHKAERMLIKQWDKKERERIK